MVFDGPRPQVKTFATTKLLPFNTTTDTDTFLILNGLVSRSDSVAAYEGVNIDNGGSAVVMMTTTVMVQDDC